MPVISLPAINGGTSHHRNGNGRLTREQVLQLPQSERILHPIGALRETGLKVIDSADQARAQWVGDEGEFHSRVEIYKGGRPLGMPSS